jgi:PAS domain S-box-containing protein
MDQLNSLELLLRSQGNIEALDLLHEVKSYFSKSEFSIKRLTHDKRIVQQFLNNTIQDLEKSNAELNLLREAEIIERDLLLRKTQYHLNKISNEISSGIAYIDKDLKYIIANQSYLKWVDKKFEEVEGKPIAVVLGIERFYELKPYIEDALVGKRHDIETSFLDKNQNIIHVKASYIPSYDENNEIQGIYIFEQDITEIYQINQELENKNVEMERYIESNLQLENFAHIASHDLKAPLNNIYSFADLLMNSSREKLNDDEQKILKLMLMSSKNMKQTIDALMQFSLATNQKAVFHKVNLNEILHNLKIELQESIQAKNAEVIISEMPDEIVCDENLIRQLFQNLILNAIKFTQKDLTPLVEINALKTSNYWRFNIRDNGIGIDKENFEKIFLLFQRLHTRTTFDGTGIGLATCKKIVEVHKGTIFVESELNKGSNFVFTIKQDLI